MWEWGVGNGTEGEEVEMAKGAAQVDGQETVAGAVEEVAGVAAGQGGGDAVKPEVGQFFDHGGTAQVAQGDPAAPPVGQAGARRLDVEDAVPQRQPAEDVLPVAPDVVPGVGGEDDER